MTGAGPLAALDPARRAAVTAVARAAASRGATAYLVGGVVRDLALGLDPGPDLDVTVVGDAQAVAEELVGALGGRVTRHARFETATWRHGRLVVDIVRARAERYDRPGALPRVRPGTLADDLARRDVTINALAVRLGEDAADVVDPHGGEADMAAGRVRVLTARSFTDDPTRIFRAARFAARLGFALAPDTVEWARAAVAVGALGTVSPARIGREIAALLAEARPGRALAALEALGVWRALDLPDAAAAGARRSADALPAAWAAQAAMGAALEGAAPPAAARALWWAAQAPVEGARAWRPRHRRETRLAEAIVAARGHPALRAGPGPAAVALESVPDEAVLGAWLLTPADDAARGALGARLARAERPFPLDGRDVLALGAPPGPRVGAILARARAAWAEGTLADRAAALALVRELVDAGAHAGGSGRGAAG